MADTKISDFAAQTTMLAADLLVTAQEDASNKKITWENLRLASNIFPATAVPSADPNTLDDYEEGYHEPTVTCSTSGSYVLDTAFDILAYTKIGREVCVSGILHIESESSPVGDIRVSMPFTGAPLTKGAEQFMGLLRMFNHGGDIRNPYCHMQNAGFVLLYKISDAGVIAVLNEGDVDTNFFLFLSICYATV